MTEERLVFVVIDARLFRGKHHQADGVAGGGKRAGHAGGHAFVDDPSRWFRVGILAEVGVQVVDDRCVAGVENFAYNNVVEGGGDTVANSSGIGSEDRRLTRALYFDVLGRSPTDEKSRAAWHRRQGYAQRLARNLDRGGRKRGGRQERCRSCARSCSRGSRE